MPWPTADDDGAHASGPVAPWSVRSCGELLDLERLMPGSGAGRVLYSMRVALAQEVAATDHAYLLTASNELARASSGLVRVPIASAVAMTSREYVSPDAASYVVDVHPAWVAGDYDGPDGEAVALLARKTLDRLGLRGIWLASGEEGHHHLWVRPGSRSRRAEVLAALETLGYDVRARIRPPLAPHRLGLDTGPLEGDLRDVLRHFGGQPGRLEAARSARSGEVDYAELLRLGDVDGRYRSRSEVLHALTCWLQHQGYGADEAYGILADPAHEGAAKLHDRIRAVGDDRARQWWERQWRRAEASSVGVGSARTGTPEEVDAAADGLDIVAHEMALAADDDASMRRARLVARVAERMREVGSIEIEAAVRSRWLDDLGAPDTISRALTALSTGPDAVLRRWAPVSEDRGYMVAPANVHPQSDSGHTPSSAGASRVRSRVHIDEMRQWDLQLLRDPAVGRAAGLGNGPLRVVLRARRDGVVELSPSDESLGGQRNARSRWLRDLADAGLATREKRGREVVYRLAEPSRDDLDALLAARRLPRAAVRQEMRRLRAGVARLRLRRARRLAAARRARRERMAGGA